MHAGNYRDDLMGKMVTILRNPRNLDDEEDGVVGRHARILLAVEYTQDDVKHGNISKAGVQLWISLRPHHEPLWFPLSCATLVQDELQDSALALWEMQE